MYKKKELEKMALAVLAEHKLYFIQQLIRYLPCNSATFYNHKLEKSEAIIDRLNDNKIDIKDKIFNDWQNSSYFPAQKSLYMLLADEDEYSRLSGNKDITDAMKKTPAPIIHYSFTGDASNIEKD